VKSSSKYKVQRKNGMVEGWNEGMKE